MVYQEASKGNCSTDPRVLEQDHIFHSRELKAAVAGVWLSSSRDWAPDHQLLPTWADHWVVKLDEQGDNYYKMMLCLNVCVPPKSICWNPNPQGDIILEGEVFGRWLGQESRAFKNGISALTEEAWEISLALSTVWGYGEKTAIYEEVGSHRHQICWHHDLALPNLQNLEK